MHDTFKFPSIFQFCTCSSTFHDCLHRNNKCNKYVNIFSRPPLSPPQQPTPRMLDETAVVAAPGKTSSEKKIIWKRSSMMKNDFRNYFLPREDCGGAPPPTPAAKIKQLWKHAFPPREASFERFNRFRNGEEWEFEVVLPWSKTWLFREPVKVRWKQIKITLKFSVCVGMFAHVEWFNLGLGTPKSD